MRRGRRLSIIGFLQPIISFVYGLVIGGVDRKSYIQMMEQEAADAGKTGHTRVIVQDNGPIHALQRGAKSVVEMGEPGFVHLLFTQILL
ncbi:hypothetical protein VB735_28365 [Halotia wernerae UHCC 0503]|nr:hypothetical protein [Halotia wernerae UHCC 0503]